MKICKKHQTFEAIELSQYRNFVIMLSGAGATRPT